MIKIVSIHNIILTNPLKCAIAGFNCSVILLSLFLFLPFSLRLSWGNSNYHICNDITDHPPVSINDATGQRYRNGSALWDRKQLSRFNNQPTSVLLLVVILVTSYLTISPLRGEGRIKQYGPQCNSIIPLVSLFFPHVFRLSIFFFTFSSGSFFSDWIPGPTISGGWGTHPLAPRRLRPWIAYHY